MGRLIRSGVAVVLAATVALGANTSAVAAPPSTSHGDKVGHAAAGKNAEKSVRKDGRSTKRKAERLSPRQRRLARQAGNKDAYLGRLTRLPKVKRLDESVQPGLLTNIGDDRGTLASLKDAARSSTGSDLTEVAKEIRSVRPAKYHTIVNQLRIATRLQEPVAALPQAGELSALIDTLLGYDATTARSDLRAAQRVLATVKEAVEAAGAGEDAEAGDTVDDGGGTTDGTT